MADKRISQLVERTDIANNDVVPIVASGATTTNKATISSIQEFMQENLDLGVTSVGITLGTTGTDVNVTGSPITTSGNITINIPTASASNRGLLSSSDWTSFNGKVPYTGATTSVDLGDNVLTAGGLNIDNLGANGGALNLRQATSFSLWSGAPYTSIYATPGNRLIINFSNDNRRITLDGSIVSASTPRTFTFPDATGTLALTSDITNALTGYVTLGTAQTITGQKTFNSTIVGQDATLTSSGSNPTLLVTHSSGSGIALDISKGGNGEGLRVTKTSGTGNAVTITGGALSAVAGQFSGDLQSSTRVIAVNGGESIILTPNSGGSTNRIEGSAGAPLHIVTNGSSLAFAAGGTTPQMILSNVGNLSLSGALNGTSASFSGRVNVNGATDDASKALNVGGNGYSFFGGSVSGLTPNNIGLSIGYNRSGANGESSIIYGAPAAGFNFEIASVTSGTITPRLTITNTGAATFSSSVTANGSLIVNEDGAGTKVISIRSNFAGVDPAINVSTNNALLLQTNNTERMRITSAGNVGIGTDSPQKRLDVFTTASSATEYQLSLRNGAGANDVSAGIAFGFNSSSADPDYLSAISSIITNRSTRAADLTFLTAATGTLVERMRITSGGNVLVNQTSELDSTISLQINNKSNGGILVKDGANSGWLQRFWDNSNNLVGSITRSGAITLYNTSSDYRLKENITPLQNALSKINKLKPCTFNFISHPENNVIGFIAHEVQEVIPEAVHGKKDDVEIKKVELSPAEIDEEGNVIIEAVIEEKEVPIYQGIDNSKLVPLLVAAIQELKTEIDSLKNQIK